MPPDRGRRASDRCWSAALAHAQRDLVARTLEGRVGRRPVAGCHPVATLAVQPGRGDGGPLASVGDHTTVRESALVAGDGEPDGAPGPRVAVEQHGDLEGRPVVAAHRFGLKGYKVKKHEAQASLQTGIEPSS